MGARVALSAAPASDRCDRRLGAASCRECGGPFPEAVISGLYVYMYAMHVSLHVYNIFMFIIQYNVYYSAVTQQMDNVALSCLSAMANVAVSYCRDGLCRSGLWARCLLTHSQC